MYNCQKSKFVTIVSLLTILSGVLVICGWLLDIELLKTLLPQYVAIKFQMAVCLILLGAIALLTQTTSKKYSRPVYVALSIIVFLFGLFGVLQYFLQFHTIIDQAFVNGDDIMTGVKYTYNSYITINSSLCILLFGAAFLLFTTKNNRLHIAAQYMLHLVTIISAVAIIGYLYGLSLFYNYGYVSSMPVHIALFFLMISASASLLHPHYGLTNLFKGDKVGNRMARMLFFPLEFIFIVLGFLRFKAQYSHFLTLELSMYLLTIIMLVICLVIVTVTARWLNRVDEKRTLAENEVITINNSLEKMVEERSAELMNMVEKLGESERKYRSLIEHASDAIYVLDLDNNITEVNASMCKMTGYTRDELLQLKITQLLEPEHLKA
ncbi:MAG TPA: PAS domain S-box protein, partial [Mucilaginibacter sp.]